MLCLKNSRVIYYKFRIRKNSFSIFCRSSSTYNESVLLPDQQKQIEEKWKDAIVNYTCKNSVDNSRNHEKKYILSMFPYPSGNLHLGHVRVYTLSDVFARYYHMNGWNVIHPMGWDAFGLPAENAAIERGVNPQEWTKSNIKSMRNQLQNLGFSFDWWREVATCDPSYYKWTQFIFLKLFQEGLAYRKEAIVNWDPIDQTVLANEQISEQGFSWRSGSKVEKKLLTQWFIKCTKFSKDLFEDLSDPLLKNWDEISAIQKNWIGDCNGYMVEIKLIKDNKLIDSFSHLSVWMQEPEYLSSIGFLSVKTDHVLNMDCYIDDVIDKFKILNVKAVDPISNRLIPIIVSDSACEEAEIRVGNPTINERDRQICEMLKLSIPQPIIERDKDLIRKEIINKLKDINSGGYQCSSSLKDWLISRQRYWGTPIPIIYCDDCGTVPVPEEQLPVILPSVKEKIEKGFSLLKETNNWLKCPCPRCGKLGKRETDTMDTFVDSSWYFLRYLDAENNKDLIDKDKAYNLMPVDVYIGGKEHAVLHLYYARFIHKFLSGIGLTSSYKEPFRELLIQGLIKSKSYKVKSSGKYLRNEEVDFSVTPPVEKNTNESLIIEFEKMSKSKHNGVNPQALLDKFGIDALRLAILSSVGSYFDRLWSTEDMDISYKIMSKLWFNFNIFVRARREQNINESSSTFSKDEFTMHETFLAETRNQTILRVNHHFEVTKQFHLAISNIQEMSRKIRSVPKHLIMSEEYEKCLRCVLLLFSPLCPHLCCELWQKMNSVSTLEVYKKISNIFEASWPSVDPTYNMELRCDVNDEEICTIRIPQSEYSTLTQETAIELVYKNEQVSSLLNGSPILNMEFEYNPKYVSYLDFKTKTKSEIRKMKKKQREEKKRLWEEKNKTN